MAIIKYAEMQFSLNEIYNPKVISSNKSLSALLLHPAEAKVEEEIKQRFVKFAGNLKKIAPKANDFLYFSTVMLCSAEHSLIDKKTGEPLKDKNGNSITAEWEINPKTGSWKWKCSDQNIKAHKNNNGDIFPEVELKKAHRKWIGRPLCKDHQSSSVDGIRGIIVDTYYDDKFKRVIGLCALDKINYPDLARKVATGYANNVSMGTAVGKSICYECGNVAKVEADYCLHVKKRTTYGEINIDLSPIELSLVVTGAEPGAQLRSIIASVNKYSEEKQERIEELQKAGCVTSAEFDRLGKELEDLRNTVASLLNTQFKKVATVDPEKRKEALELSEILSRSPGLSTGVKEKITKNIEELLKETEEVIPPYGMAGKKEMTYGDAQVGQDETGNPPDFTLEHRDTRMASDLGIGAINKKLDAMQHALRELTTSVQKVDNNKEETKMSDSKLRERAAARRATFQKAAYFQGGGGLNEPQTYPVDPMNDKLKTDGDKQMEGQGMETGVDGMHPGYDSFGMSEEALKKKLSRAELEERRIKRHALLATAVDTMKAKDSSGKEITLVKGPNGKWQEADDDLPTKKAYFQGGGGVNEPQSYPVDPMNDKLKTDGDKQMEGQGMEPGADGLHPGYKSYGDELKLKQKLLRADEKLRAKFVVAYKNEEGTVIDKNNSRWEVYAGKDKVLSATGKEIYEDTLEKNWDILASKRYGMEVIRAIRQDGLAKVAYLLKGTMVKTAQEPAMPPMPPMPGADAGAPPPMPPMPPMPGAEEPVEEDKEKKADNPVDQAIESLDKCMEDAEKHLGDLKDALQESTGKTEETNLPSPAEADDEECEGDEECESDDDEMSAVAELTSRVREIYAALDESADEIAMLAESLESRSRIGKTATSDVITHELLKLAADAVQENEELCSEASLIVDAKKKAKKDKDEECEKEDKKSKKFKKFKKDEDEDEVEEKKAKKSKKSKKDEDEDEEDEDEEKEDKKAKKGKKSKAEMMLENLLTARAAKRREIAKQAQEDIAEDLGAEELGDVGFDIDEGDVEVESLKNEINSLREELDSLKSIEESEPEHEELIEVDEVPEMSLDDQLAQLLDEGEAVDLDDDGLASTAEDRRAWRAKVAAEVGSKYQLKLDKAVCCDTDMPIGKSHGLGSLDTKSEGNEVEGIGEQFEKIMKQVETVPAVREAVEKVYNLMKSGALSEADLDDAAKLQALAVDPAAAKYWKEYFGQADAESKEFANELVKEYGKKQAAASLDEVRVKMARAYDLGLEMQEKGMIAGGVSTLHKQVEEIMNFDPKSFESFKKAVARVSKKGVVKTAAPALDVGVQDTIGDEVEKPANITEQLKKLWK